MRSKHLRRVIQESLSPSVGAYSAENVEDEHHLEALRREASEQEDAASNAKRQRPSPTDTDDELLAAAGEPTKRLREDQ
jgi:hypothetical protein